MYISRRKPTTRESRIATSSNTVAENAVCTREGFSNSKKRRVRDTGGRGVLTWLGVSSFKGFEPDGIMGDSTWEITGNDGYMCTLD